MIGGLFSGGLWPVKTVKGVVTAWLIGEIVAFCLAVKLLGLGTTLLVMFGTSLLGMAMLRRIGLDAAQQLRRRMMAPDVARDGFVDGTLTALGAVLLILPGFVSDAAGLALSTPSLRQGLAARLLKQGPLPGSPASVRRPNPDVIDLSPDDWRVVDKSGRA
ncbi:FxsA family protein [Lichenihabitans sp. Uapishka_5]|uniref:FxsA family protein n=1 Tax=Lichenihabitans sp. Uapishka_5 TaxID=3037302 RepID=UPI0029E828F4|nr:FxsA family protein [Lichenihabitans sp. Uapishka_5]MDX7951439.1 FxsA family protein [Lichenihabitans sp. Uapishka_5]